MTHNQIDYWNLMETKRHNRETEKLGKLAQDETGRHNLSTETISSQSNAISKEHYERSDNINALHYERSDAEQKRHNQTDEDIKYWQNRLSADKIYLEMSESRRHNKAVENENIRHNTAQESIDAEKNSINKTHYENQDVVNMFNAQENQRHNIASENLTTSTIAETSRHNQATELQAKRELELESRSLDESIRSHRANESINSTSNAIRQQELAVTRANTKLYERELDIKQQSADTERLKSLNDSELKQSQVDLNYANRDLALKEKDWYNLNQLSGVVYGGMNAYSNTVNANANAMSSSSNTMKSILSTLSGTLPDVAY